MAYVTPAPFAASFTCPHCGTVAQQHWWARMWDARMNSDNRYNPIRVSRCTHCGERTLWIDNKMYYPDNGNVPFPNPEMPEAVKEIYLEAASIFSKSPRGAAALLRLGIQVLCKELGEEGKNVNTDIASLVDKGLPAIVQQSLDIVRVTGNDAVHPGVIDADDENVVSKLFELMNVIVQYMITLPHKIGDLYNSLPPDKIAGINNRDK